MGLRVALPVLFTLISVVGARANSPAPDFPLGDFLVGRAPAATAGAATDMPVLREVERGAAVKGEEYAVIAPLYLTSDPLSFIRLFNGGGETAAFDVSVVGTPSGTIYGTARLQVPALASVQYSISQILVAAGVSSIPGDTTYSFYIQSAEKLAGYQHILFSNTTGFFENVSLCRHSINEAARSILNSVVVTNVHTSALVQLAGGYPSQIEAHNYRNAQAVYRFTVVSGETGTQLGQINFTMAANSTYAIPFSQIQQSLSWTPSASQHHVNIVVTDVSGLVPDLVLGHSIVNTRQTNTVLNMGAVCAVNVPEGAQ